MTTRTSAQAEVRIVPSFRGFQKTTSAGVKAAKVDPLEIKVRLDRKSLDAAEKDARVAAERVKRARDVEATAAEKVRLAEARLTETRKRSTEGSASLIAAENRVSQARRSSVAATTAATKATVDHDAAVRKAADAQRKLDQSLRGNGSRRIRLGVDASQITRAIGSNRTLRQELLLTAKAAGVLSAAMAGIGVGGAALAALPGVVASAASGIGVLVGSLSGVGDALKAYKDQQDDAAQVAAQAARTATSNARAIRDAESQIEQARRQQVRTARDGAQQIAAARQRVIDAVEDEKSAQAELSDAYDEARRSIEDLKNAQLGYALDAESAAIALARQEERTREVLSSSTASALDKREAINDLRQSQLRLSEAQQRQRQGQEDLTDAERKGVAGSDQVVAAQSRLRDAQDNVRSSREDLARTQASAAEANEDAARAVASAVENLRDVQAEQAESARVAAEQNDKFADAMAKLSPEARGLVTQLISMQGLFEGLKRAAGSEFLPGVTQMLKDSEGLFPIFEGNLRRTGEIMGDTARKFGDLFKSEGFKRDLDQMLRNSEIGTAAISRNFLRMTESVVRFGADTGPIQRGFADLMDRSVSGVEKFLAKLSTPVANESLARTLRAIGSVIEILLPMLADLIVWVSDRVGPALEAFARWLDRNRDNIDDYALAVLGIYGAVKALNIATKVTGWAKGIASAFNIIGDSADRNRRKVDDLQFGKNDGKGRRGGIAGLKALGIGVGLGVGGSVLQGVTPGEEGDKGLSFSDWVGNALGGQAIDMATFDFEGMITRAKDAGRRWGLIAADVVLQASEMYRGVLRWWNGTGDGVNESSKNTQVQSAGWWDRIKLTVVGKAAEIYAGVMMWFQRKKFELIGLVAGIFASVSLWWDRTKLTVVGKAAEIYAGVTMWFQRKKFELIGLVAGIYASVSLWWFRTKAEIVGKAAEIYTGVMMWFQRKKRELILLFVDIYIGVVTWWEDTKRGILNTAKDLKDRFITTVTDLKDTLIRRWSELQNGFREPIRWVIDVVYNQGVGGLWNAARTIIPGLPEFARADTGVLFRARGGAVAGPGTATSDSIPARLSDGEHVWTAKEVDRAGGHGYVMALRNAALNGSLPQFANGGPVMWQDLWNTVRGAFPGARLSSWVRPGDPGEHGAGRAIDVVDRNMVGLSNWIAQRFPGSHEIIHTPGANVFNGRPHTYNAATRAGHWDHVHWAHVSKDGEGGGAGGMFSGVWSAVLDQVRGLYDSITNPLRGAVGRMFPDRALAHAMPREGVNVMLDRVRDALFGAAGASDAGAPGTGPVVDQVRAVASRFGWGDGAQWSALSRLIMKESSWDPTADNPNSSAFGLFQFLNSTWKTVRGFFTTNPAQQAEFGLRYIAQRYKDPIGALGFHLRNNWYENGGVLKPGATMALNGTGKNEYVLNDSQWRAASAAIRETQRSRVEAPRSQPVRGQVFGDVHVSERVDLDVVMQRAAFEAARLMV